MFTSPPAANTGRYLMTLKKSARLLSEMKQIKASGVEEQLSYLEKLGCHEFQGFFFSKAKPEKETIELIIQNAKGTKKTH